MITKLLNYYLISMHERFLLSQIQTAGMRAFTEQKVVQYCM